MQTATNIIGVAAALLSILIAGRPGHPPKDPAGNAIFVPSMQMERDGGDRSRSTRAGAHLLSKYGCLGCHSVNGSLGAGPTFKDMAGSTRPLRDGSIVVADDEYIRESILEPARRFVHGFGPAMPSYQGRVSEREIAAMTKHLRSLSVHSPSAGPMPSSQPVD